MTPSCSSAGAGRDASARAVLDGMRPPSGIAAVAVVRTGGDVDIASTGRHPDAEWFELGSVTKTFTATLLARLVLDGVVQLDTTVGDLLGARAGRAARSTLRQLATHTSGLPRLPAGALRPPFWPRDPYRFFGERRLWRSLGRVDTEAAGSFEYSNLGFDLLALALSTAAGAPFAELLRTAVFEPGGMATARCQPCPRRGLVRGYGPWYLGGRRWHQPLPGAGGVDGTIHDVAAWLQGNLEPDDSDLGRAIRLARRIHFDGEKSIGLAWLVDRGVRWHNGGTGCFQSVVAVGDGVAAGAVASHTRTRGYSVEPGIGVVVRPVA